MQWLRSTWMQGKWSEPAVLSNIRITRRCDDPYANVRLRMGSVVVVLMLSVPQAWAYTIFEFQVANHPYDHDNVTYTIHDQTTGDEYKWFEVGDKQYSQLSGARDALHDPEIIELEADLDMVFTYATFFAIDSALEPGTPLTMCIKFDNNEKCEQEAIADFKHFYNSAMLEVDMNTGR